MIAPGAAYRVLFFIGFCCVVALAVVVFVGLAKSLPFTEVLRSFLANDFFSSPHSFAVPAW